MNKTLLKKSIAVFLAALVVSTAALSFYYISAEAFHRCTDSRCSVCKMIEISTNLVKEGASSIAAAAAAAAFIFEGAVIAKRRSTSRAAENLITMKVRLNN